jgi:hypothetical protein
LPSIVKRIRVQLMLALKNRATAAFVAVAVLALAAGRANGGSSASSSEPSVLFAGGVTKNSTLASAELFEPNHGGSGSFVATGRMKTARVDHTATRLNSGQVLIAGGASKMFPAGTIFRSAELYNPSKGRFSDTGGMLAARTGHTATLLADGRVLIVGGSDGTTSLSSAELYDPASAKFSATGAMTIPRQECTATLLANGEVLIAGGITVESDGNDNVQDTAEIYDLSAGSFSSTGTMTSARTGPTATLLPDGQVLITGGIDNDDTVLDTAELYDPATGLFSQAGQMTTSRYGHLAAALGDGDVLVAGGIDNAGDSLASAEVFVAKSGSFVAIAPMSRDRFLVGATVLSSSEILIAGGYTQCPSSQISFCARPVKSALIFDHQSNVFRSIKSMRSPRGSFASATLSGGAH